MMIIQLLVLTAVIGCVSGVESLQETNTDSVRSRLYSIYRGHKYSELFKQKTLPTDSLAECMVACSNKDNSCFYANYDVTSKQCSVGDFRPDHLDPALLPSVKHMAIKLITCPGLIPPIKSTLTSDTITGPFGTTVVFTCDRGYSFDPAYTQSNTQTLTCTAAGIWDVPLGTCSEMCKTTQLGKEYLGHKSIDHSGKTCQYWSSQSPHQHNKTADSMFPDGSIVAAANYCRNPDNEPEGPWCYTTDLGTRWDYCDVRFC